MLKRILLSTSKTFIVVGLILVYIYAVLAIGLNIWLAYGPDALMKWMVGCTCLTAALVVALWE